MYRLITFCFCVLLACHNTRNDNAYLQGHTKQDIIPTRVIKALYQSFAIDLDALWYEALEEAFHYRSEERLPDVYEAWGHIPASRQKDLQDGLAQSYSRLKHTVTKRLQEVDPSMFGREICRLHLMTLCQTSKPGGAFSVSFLTKLTDKVLSYYHPASIIARRLSLKEPLGEDIENPLYWDAIFEPYTPVIIVGKQISVFPKTPVAKLISMKLINLEDAAELLTQEEKKVTFISSLLHGFMVYLRLSGALFGLMPDKSYDPKTIAQRLRQEERYLWEQLQAQVPDKKTGLSLSTDCTNCALDPTYKLFMPVIERKLTSYLLNQGISRACLDSLAGCQKELALLSKSSKFGLVSPSGRITDEAMKSLNSKSPMIPLIQHFTLSLSHIFR